MCTKMKASIKCIRPFGIRNRDQFVKCRSLGRHELRKLESFITSRQTQKFIILLSPVYHSFSYAVSLSFHSLPPLHLPPSPRASLSKFIRCFVNIIFSFGISAAEAEAPNDNGAPNRRCRARTINAPMAHPNRILYHFHVALSPDMVRVGIQRSQEFIWRK